LILSPSGPAILLKKTKLYWYYFFSPTGRVSYSAEARISQKRLWEALDCGRLNVSYQLGMKRKKKKKDRTLDLHGVRHDDVSNKLRLFLNFIDLPAYVMTGNSIRMKKIVESIVKEYGWSVRESVENQDKLLIEEGTHDD